MEIHFKLTYKLPKELMTALHITDDTPFEAYCEDGTIHIHALTDEEWEERHEPTGDDAYEEGFEDGYKEALWEHGLLDDEDAEEESDEDDEDECGGDACEYCEYFCRHCKKCVLDAESEEKDSE